MKRLFLIAMLLLMVLPAAFAAGDAEGGKPLICFIMKARNSQFWEGVAQGAEAAAAELSDELDFIIDWAPTEADVDLQLNAMEDCVAQGASALAVAPTAPDQFRPFLQDYIAEGLPVLLVDTDVSDLPGKTSFVGTDNVTVGRLAAEYAIANAGGNTAVFLEGMPGVTSGEDRKEGFLAGIQGSAVTVERSLTANWDRAQAVTVMENILQAVPNPDIIMAANDNMILGALEAVKNAGLDLDSVMLIGVDGNLDAVKSVCAGELDLTVAQNTGGMGALAVQEGLRAARGESVDIRIDTGAILIDASNCADYGG